MGIFDNIKKKLGENRDKIDQAVDKAGDLVDERTGGKYADKVDQAQNMAKRQADQHIGESRQDPPEGPRPS